MRFEPFYTCFFNLVCVVLNLAWPTWRRRLRSLQFLMMIKTADYPRPNLCRFATEAHPSFVSRDCNQMGFSASDGAANGQ